MINGIKWVRRTERRVTTKTLQKGKVAGMNQERAREQSAEFILPRSGLLEPLVMGTTMSTAYRPNRLSSYDESSILTEIKRVIVEHFQGKPLSCEEFERFSMVKGVTIRKRFGSWANAIRKAGFEYQGTDYEHLDLTRARYSEDQMLADLQRVKDLNGGRYFSQSFYMANGGKYSVKTLKKHFQSSWQSLLREQLSLLPYLEERLKIHRERPKPISQFSNESLFSEMKRVWDTVGRRPSYTEFRKLGCIGVRVYERRWGSWTKAIEAFYGQAGYETVGLPGSNATPALLLEELTRLARGSGASLFPFGRYCELGGAYSIGAFQRHFGSWKAAVERIGLRDGHTGRYSDEELFAEMQRLWEKFGRQPTYKDMNRDGTMSGGAFQKRFGSWMRAVHAFCEDRQSLSETQRKADCSSQIGTEELHQPECLEQPDVQPDESITSPDGVILVDSRRVPTLRQRFQILQRDSFQCVKCGRSPATAPGVELQVDHIIPWAQGGRTVLENLQTLCRDCNLGKSDLVPRLAP
jgi:hypothetical protein